MSWFLKINGDRDELESLTDEFNSSEVKIFKEGENYLLSSTAFDPLTSPDEVSDYGQSLLKKLNGIILSGVDHEYFTPIQLGGVARRTEGKNEHFLTFTDSVNFRCRVKIRAFQNEQPIEKKKVLDKLLLKSLSDTNLAYVLELIEHNGITDWVSLYKIFEAIEGDMSKDFLTQTGWISMQDIKLFKYTANSRKATGIHGRHGAESTQPPKDPMSIFTAKKLIESLMHQWFAHKLNS